MKKKRGQEEDCQNMQVHQKVKKKIMTQWQIYIWSQVVVMLKVALEVNDQC